MTSMPTTTPRRAAPRLTTPRVTAAGVTCGWCRDTGWADPFEVYDGSPPFVSCPDCLGAGIPECTTCEGEGAVPVATPCPACDTGVVLLG